MFPNQYVSDFNKTIENSPIINMNLEQLRKMKAIVASSKVKNGDPAERPMISSDIRAFIESLRHADIKNPKSFDISLDMV